MKMRRLLVPLFLIALVVAWVGSVSAFSVSFIEPISETTAPVASTTDLVNPSIVMNPESASVTGTAPGATLSESFVAEIILVELPRTQLVSDRLDVLVTPVAAGGGVQVQATFTSLPSEELVVCFPCLFPTVAETGAPQQVFSRDLGNDVELTITVQSDVDVPEPPTLALFGFSLIVIVGTLAWRRHRRNLTLKLRRSAASVA